MTDKSLIIKTDDALKTATETPEAPAANFVFSQEALAELKASIMAEALKASQDLVAQAQLEAEAKVSAKDVELKLVNEKLAKAEKHAETVEAAFLSPNTRVGSQAPKLDWHRFGHAAQLVAYAGQKMEYKVSTIDKDGKRTEYATIVDEIHDNARTEEGSAAFGGSAYFLIESNNPEIGGVWFQFRPVCKVWC